MKLSPRDAEAYCAKPDPAKTGLLIYGADAMRVALKRQQMLAALLGPGAEEEMRLSRMNGGELRKDPALLLDAVKAVGFFPAPARSLSKRPMTPPRLRFWPLWKTGSQEMPKSWSPQAS